MRETRQVSQRDSTSAAPHIIRLHGPWRYELLADMRRGSDGQPIDPPGDLPPSGIINLPADWEATLGCGLCGRVMLQRRFGRPSNLDPNSRIDLVVRGIKGRATVTLNGNYLGQITIDEQDGRFELTDLRPRNELQIEVDLSHGPDDEVATGGIVVGVQLEIYEVTP